MSHAKRILCLTGALLALSAPATVLGEAPMDMTSDQVVELEQKLAGLGYFSSEPDATYDAQTRLSLESFQQANGLEITGAADSATLQRLNSADALSRQDYLTRFAGAYQQMPALEQGAVGNDVLLMQRRLKEYGFYAGDPNGVFDEVTRQAVASFQMVNSLSPTGVADGATLMRLTADSPITWPAFLAEMAAAEGDSGLNVYVLQKRLEEMDLFSGSCSGSFGSLTRQAVEAFQQAAGLEVTGEADSATWAALYARSASAQAAPQALRLGSAGDDVTTAQQRLNTLGFFDHEIDGEFGLTTQTAVRLFQMATDLEATGELDGATRARLMASDASSMMDAIVQRRFTMMLDDANDATQARIGQIAHDLIGTAFGTADDALYPGFPFVQYVCVAAGLPVTIPEDLIRMASRQVETLDAVENGDIVVFESTSADAVSMLLAVGAGEGRVICTTESGGWAELNFMDRMKGAKVYCWDAT